jgi:hypothetical protein
MLQSVSSLVLHFVKNWGYIKLKKIMEHLWNNTEMVEGKGKVRPITGHEGPEGE